MNVYSLIDINGTFKTITQFVFIKRTTSILSSTFIVQTRVIFGHVSQRRGNVQLDLTSLLILRSTEIAEVHFFRPMVLARMFDDGHVASVKFSLSSRRAIRSRIR